MRPRGSTTYRKGSLLTPRFLIRPLALVGALVWGPAALPLFMIRASWTSLLRREGRPDLGLGALEAAGVGLVWWVAPDPPAPGLLPLLVAVPLGEILVGWHRNRAATALDTYDDPRAFRRDMHGLATVTIGALVPPLVTGVALGAAAYRLPYELSAHPGARTLVLGLAAGVLMGGLLAVTGLLATCGHRVTAALVAAAPLVALAAPARLLLAGTVTALALAYLLGLVAAAHAAFDTDRYR